MSSLLIHVIYASTAKAGLVGLPLVDLLEKARVENRRLGLTGLLLHDDGSFFQVLEGQGPVVDAMYRKIVADPRHSQVTRIIREPIPRRFFDRWDMGFRDASGRELGGIPVMNVCSAGTRIPDPELDAGRAMKLVSSFRNGRWRKRAGAPTSSVVA